jgi:hypothetical protein
MSDTVARNDGAPERDKVEGLRQRVVEDAKEEFRTLPPWKQEQALREAEAIKTSHEQTMRR